MKVQCHTLAFGKNTWMDICLPTMMDWVIRNNYSLKIWSKIETQELVSPKFICKKILQKFLESKDEWCIWIDADIYVQKNAPSLVTELQNGLWLANDLGWKRGEHMPFTLNCGWHNSWIDWCRLNNFKIYEDWIYKNFGVWAIDRNTAKLFLEVMIEPFLSPSRLIQDQHHLNFFAAQIKDNVKILDYKWNAMVPMFWMRGRYGKLVPNHNSLEGWQGGHFIHLISEKYKKIEEIQRLGGFDKFSIK